VENNGGTPVIKQQQNPPICPKTPNSSPCQKKPQTKEQLIKPPKLILLFWRNQIIELGITLHLSFPSGQL